MSRIGSKQVTVPSGVAVEASSDQVQVKGPKGQLVFPLFREVAVETDYRNVAPAVNGISQT